ASLRLMIDGDILLPVLPEIDRAGLDRLASLIARETASAVQPSALRRLAALLPPEPRVADAVGARLKLSNKARKRLVVALESSDNALPPRALAFRIGVEGAIDRLLLDPTQPIEGVSLIEGWTPPQLPISGGALIALGLQPGPDVAKALGEVQRIWVEEGFPDAGRVAEIAGQTVSKFQRARQ
ncbi:MAG TPA: CCA tRNA nucleotidyltransferase, partial [Sphingobium sp.]